MAMLLRARSHQGYSISKGVFDVHSKHFNKVWLVDDPLVLRALWWLLLIGDVVFDDVFDLEKQNESELQELLSC